MSRRLEQLDLITYIVKWLALAGLIAILAGTSSAFFLFSLDQATHWREGHRWMIWLLPVAGFAVGLAYHLVGRPVDAGNNLLIDEIQDPKKVVPLRMVPLVLIGTLVSHLSGASVGREGTAVQMGGALADQLTHLLRLGREDRRIILMAGISAGFASVFGTPLAGALFGLEVLAIGRMRYDGLFPCMIAAIAADQIGLAWGVVHTHYVIGEIVPVQLWSMLAVVLAGIAFGLAGLLFAKLTHKLGATCKRLVEYPPLRPLLGGVAIMLAVWTLDGYQYIGLGIPSIVQAFHQPMAPWDWLGKLLFTVASLGTGFKGGEVTPLFYIGATLGNALAPLLHLPFAMLAGIGFVAVFAGAANTPLATIVMAVELFGADVAPFAAAACITSYLVSGHTGIYLAQRISHSKHNQAYSQEIRLSDIRNAKPLNRELPPLQGGKKS